MTWKFYNSVAEGLKLKAIKILELVFLRLLSYRGKTGGGTFCLPSHPEYG